MEPLEYQSFEVNFYERWIEHMKEAVPELRYLNWDLGQLEYYTMDSPAVSWPCALLDFDDTSYADLLDNAQEGTPVIVVRLGFNPFSGTSSLQPKEVRTKGNFYFELEQKVYQALQGWDAGGLCQPLNRVRKTKERREEDAFRVRVLLFTSSYTDESATAERQALQVPVEVQPELGS